MMPVERLQKIISRAGVASRRKAEELILQGRVTVDGQVIHELGTKADWPATHIKVDGKLLRPPERLVYLALNKPRGYVTTRSDPQGRPTVMDLVAKTRLKDNVYPVGRLDFHTEGLLLFTNDGDFANRLTSAASGISKTYWAKVRGLPQQRDIERLREGVVLDGRRTLPAKIRLIRTTERETPEDSANSWYEITITEGRQNQIRRMFELVGHPVQKLKRVQIGPVSLGNLPLGQLRLLSPEEIRAAGSERKAADAKARRERHPERHEGADEQRAHERKREPKRELRREPGREQRPEQTRGPKSERRSEPRSERSHERRRNTGNSKKFS
jgi:23S rRNA pseudouridine2605 synthase